jgi:hypothetical protein
MLTQSRKAAKNNPSDGDVYKRNGVDETATDHPIGPKKRPALSEDKTGLEKKKTVTCQKPRAA